MCNQSQAVKSRTLFHEGDIKVKRLLMKPISLSGERNLGQRDCLVLVPVRKREPFVSQRSLLSRNGMGCDCGHRIHGSTVAASAGDFVGDPSGWWMVLAIRLGLLATFSF